MGTAAEHARTLTDYEQLGFGTGANLADGHAYHALNAGQALIVDRMRELWARSDAQSIPESEDLYVRRYADLIGSPALRGAGHHLILPTASNSIDLVAAYLRLTGGRVLLTHPTFDNLALILRRRGVDVHPVSEREVVEAAALDRVPAGADVLFLVDPNNPTGTRLSAREFTAIAAACAEHGVVLVVDASFRLFYPQTWDAYGVLESSGASYVVFEDTGKVFPTQDMKASLLTCSADHAPALRELYNEIYLCVSKFSLMVLGEFFDDARATGLDAAVRTLVARRRAHLRRVLGERLVEPMALPSRIGVEWLSTARTGRDDEEVTADLRRRGVGVLPGRGFFWARRPGGPGRHNVRVSLMKPEDEFERGVDVLAEYFAEVVR
ncbi:pyridoxal phosphate-dependent aminotransferase [Actinosynnema sp. NPDC053489]|uniref:pyridoxal phosphate-dependent aminotransferase n=1 Tax=Actinosynnema sp. NPDC053489 TaxID=3363916 RepID=UPI0037C9B9E6